MDQIQTSHSFSQVLITRAHSSLWLQEYWSPCCHQASVLQPHTRSPNQMRLRGIIYIHKYVVGIQIRGICVRFCTCIEPINVFPWGAMLNWLCTISVTQSCQSFGLSVRSAWLLLGPFSPCLSEIFYVFIALPCTSSTFLSTVLQRKVGRRSEQINKHPIILSLQTLKDSTREVLFDKHTPPMIKEHSLKKGRHFWHGCKLTTGCPFKM